jgi:hypothetical protein
MPFVRVSAQLAAIALIATSCAGSARAYGPTGHRIVGVIAESYLCGNARDAVAELLDGESLAEAGLWADRIRGDPAWRHAGPWHYVNVPDDAPVESADGGDRGDVLWAIARFRAELAHPAVAPRHRAEALRFLVHFVADVHQPLHVGRAGDRGGNEIDVLLGSRRTNLHQLWDAQALLRADRRSRDYRVADQARAARALTVGDVAALQRASFIDWARESQQLRHNVYRSVPPAGGAPFRPGADYLTAARELSLLRLSQAGVRLAGMLNGIFCARPIH